MAEPSEDGKILRLKQLIDQTPGMSGKLLAEKINTQPQTISRYISGDVWPPPHKLVAMAKVLNVDLRELFIETKGVDQPVNEQVKRKLREALELLEGEENKGGE